MFLEASSFDTVKKIHLHPECCFNITKLCNVLPTHSSDYICKYASVQ